MNRQRNDHTYEPFSIEETPAESYQQLPTQPLAQYGTPYCTLSKVAYNIKASADYS